MNFDAMARKTVLKRLLNYYGIISIDQQSAALATALQSDQAVITEDGLRYLDNERGEEKVVPFNEVINLHAEETSNDDSPDDSNDDSEETK